MKVSFTARHFTASNDLKEYCNQAVQKLNNFFDHITSCDVILEPASSSENPQKAEINVHVPSKVLTVSVAATTYERAVHDGIENLSRQLKRYKQKRFAKY